MSRRECAAAEIRKSAGETTGALRGTGGGCPADSAPTSSAASPQGWKAMVHAPFCNKPDARMVHGCKCGANVFCATCGWGRGATPCKCNRKVGVNA